MNARQGWLVLAGYVAIYEILCTDDELLSRGFYRCTDKHPILPRLAVLLVALHLNRWLPPWADLVGFTFHIGRFWRRLLS